MTTKSDVGIVFACKLDKNNGKLVLSEESRQRVDLGIKIYNEGNVKNLLMVGGHKDFGEKYGVSVAEVMADYAIQKGINREDVLVQDISLDTAGDIIFSKQGIIDLRGWREILLITHDWHYERTKREAEHIFGTNYNLRGEIIPSNEVEIRAEAEKNSFKAFQKTFLGIEMGNNRAVLGRLLEEHPMYEDHQEYFITKFNLLKEK